MTAVAYGLRDEYAGTTIQEVDGEALEVPVFSGGLIVAGDEDFDVRQALDEGNGVIVVAASSSALISALDEYPALKRVEVPEDAPAQVSQYDEMTVAELRAEAKRRELSGLSSANKDALTAALVEHDERLADGDTAVQSSPDHPVGVTEGGLDTDGDGDPDPAPDETPEA